MITGGFARGTSYPPDAVTDARMMTVHDWNRVPQLLLHRQQTPAAQAAACCTGRQPLLHRQQTPAAQAADPCCTGSRPLRFQPRSR